MEKKNIRIKRKIITALFLLLFIFIIIKISPIFVRLASEERKKRI